MSYAETARPFVAASTTPTTTSPVVEPSDFSGLSILYPPLTPSSEDSRIKRIVPTPEHHTAFKVLRRLQGFLVEIDGPEARVNFVEDGRCIEYVIPSDRLLKADIRSAHQPFEMDEFEMRMNDGGYSVGYSFKPMAKHADVFNEPLSLDEGRKHKLRVILEKLRNAQD